MMHRHIESGQDRSLPALTQQLSNIEKRDWELWIIASVTGLLAAVGLLSVIIPAAFMKTDEVHF
jgi:hypothetical protein